MVCGTLGLICWEDYNGKPWGSLRSVGVVREDAGGGGRAGAGLPPRHRPLRCARHRLGEPLAGGERARAVVSSNTHGLQ